MESLRGSRWMWYGAAFALAGTALTAVLLLRALREPVGPTAAVAAYAVRAEDDELPVLWTAPRFAFRDARGAGFTSESLAGSVWVADFIFTRCTAVCPALSARMASLVAALPDPGIHFVSFSVDPEHDTSEVLAQYARLFRAPERWHFLATDPAGLAAVAAGMRVFVTPPEADTPIRHSSLFLLIDRENRVRGVYDSEFDGTTEQLVRDACRLAGVPTGPRAAPAAPGALSPPDESPGSAAFTRRGCIACHGPNRAGPSLDGCAGRRVRLADGRTVVADDDYLRESILDPGAKIVAGYPAMMPSYRGQLAGDELAALVDHLKHLRAGPGTAPTPEPGELDPVCAMRVTRGASTPVAVRAGKTYLFCSAACRDQFLKGTARP